MRIGIDLFSIQSPSSRGRGIGRYALHLVEALLRRQAGDEQNADGLEYVLYWTQGFPEASFPDAPRVRNVRLTADGPLGGADWQGLVDRNPENLDLFLTISPFEHIQYVLPSAPVNGPRMVAVMHDLIPLLFPGQYLTDDRGQREYYGVLEKLQQYDLLLANSETTRNDVLTIMGLTPDRAVTVGAASDEVIFRRDPLGEAGINACSRALRRKYGIDSPYVLSVSGMDPRKNLRGLVEAFAHIPLAVREESQLVITCGLSKNDEECIRALARDLGIAENLVLTGGVSDEVLVTLYQGCAVFGFPSLYEGFGFPLLEAMNCGAPVVAGENSSQVEVVGDAGLLVNAADPIAFGAALGRVLSERELAADLRSRSLNRAALFTWSHVADRTLDGFVRLVSSDRVRGTENAASRAEPETGTDLGTSSSESAITSRVGRITDEGFGKVSDLGLAGRGGSRMRRSKRRPRLAVLATLPPAQGGRAEWAEGFTERLAERYLLDVFHPPGRLPGLTLRNREIGRYDVRLFPRMIWTRDYLDVVTIFENNADHARFLNMLDLAPGLAIVPGADLCGMLSAWQSFGMEPPETILDDLARESGFPEGGAARGDALWSSWSVEPGGVAAASRKHGISLCLGILERSRVVVAPTREAADRLQNLASRIIRDAGRLHSHSGIPISTSSATPFASVRSGKTADVAVIPPCASVTEPLDPMRRAEVRSRWRIPEDAFILISFSGDDSESRSLGEEVISAFAALLLTQPRGVLLHVGENPQERTPAIGQHGAAAPRATATANAHAGLGRLVEMLELRDQVRFVGRVNASDLGELFDIADLGMMLRRPPSGGEFPPSLAKALAAGLPTLICDDDAPEDIPQNALHRIPWRQGGQAALRQALLTLTQAPDLRMMLRANARDYAARALQPATIIQKYLDLIPKNLGKDAVRPGFPRIRPSESRRYTNSY